MFADIVEQHVDAAVFLYARRRRAVVAWQHDARTLRELDARLEAHLDGLRVAGAPAGAMCVARAEDGDVGGLFAGAQRALDARDARAFAKLLDLAHALEAAEVCAATDALALALGWTSLDRARWAIAALLAPASPAKLRALGVRASAAHGEHPGAELANSLHASDVDLVRAALRAAGDLGARDVAGALGQHLVGPAAFEAGRAAVLLGDPAGIEPLLRVAEGGGADAHAALMLAGRGGRDASARASSTVDRLTLAGDGRSALVGLEALGNPARLPDVVAFMRDPSLARFAGRVFTTITGVALEPALVDRSAPPAADEDPDRALPYPDAAAALRALPSRAAPSARWLLGAPITRSACERIFTEGRQPHRAAAALELAFADPGARLRDPCAPR